MKQNNNLPIRHGDIGFIPVLEIKEGKKVEHKGSFIFALGETTGHKHVLTVDDADTLEIYETKEGFMYWLKEGGYLSHEEHETIVLPSGKYLQRQEQEKDWFSLTVRKVID